MYGWTDDGTVFYGDMFGLTRLTPDGKAKTLAQAFSTPANPFAIGGAPPVLWTGWTKGSVTLGTADLKPLEKHRSTSQMLLPDGRYLWSIGYGPEQYRVVEGPAAGTNAPPLFSEDTWSATKLGDPIELGSGAEGGRACFPVAHGSRLLLSMMTSDGVIELAGVELSPSPSLLWRAPLRFDGGSIVQAFPGDAKTIVYALDPIARRAKVAQLGWDGALGEVHELEAAGLGAADADRLLFQRDENTVVSIDTADFTEQRFVVDTATEAARAKAKKGKALDQVPTGIGDVLISPGRRLFVPWHRESLVDLDEEEELPRKLKAKEAKARAAVTTWVKDNRGRMLEAGLLDPVRFNVEKGSVGGKFWAWRPGTVGNELPIECAEFVQKQSGLPWKGFGSMG